MSATKDYLQDYSEAFDAFWEALEDAKSKMIALNDLVYDGQEIRCPVPRNDAYLLMAALRELKTEIDCYDNAKEPLRMAPILPGEIRYTCS